MLLQIAQYLIFPRKKSVGTNEFNFYFFYFMRES